MHLLNPNLLLLIEVETKHISGSKAKIVEIFADLLLTVCIVPRAAPYLKFDDILLSQIVDDHIGSGLIPCLCFNVVVTGSVDNRLQIKETRQKETDYRASSQRSGLQSSRYYDLFE